jgi:glycosyltransferase involved in cell wall biosynthesis
MQRLILSANAVPRSGGQGLNLHHMIEALGHDFDLEVFCREGADGEKGFRRVPPSRRAALIGRVPVLRRRRDWQAWYSDVDFDSRVASALPASEAFQGVTGQCLQSLRVARGRGCVTVLDSVTAHIDQFGAQMDRECARFGVRSPLSMALRRRMRAEYREADVIRVMSQVARQTFLERGFSEDRVFVATPPFALEEFPRTEFRHPVFRVCFAGLIEPWKGFHYLIEAFQASDVRDSELVLWGGPGSRPVSRYLQSRTGNDPRIRVEPVEIRKVGYGKVYGEASVLVHPSLSDGFGYVVGEAMACGVPVIVTSCSGAADLVRDGVNGYVVPPADPPAIRERLTHLAQHPGLVREMGAAARQAVGALTPDQFRAPLVGRLHERLQDRRGMPCTI